MVTAVAVRGGVTATAMATIEAMKGQRMVATLWPQTHWSQTYCYSSMATDLSLQIRGQTVVFITRVMAIGTGTASTDTAVTASAISLL